MIGRFHGPGGMVLCVLLVTLSILFPNFRICEMKRNIKLVENKRKGKNEMSMMKMYMRREQMVICMWFIVGYLYILFGNKVDA
jgi:preprotein translocase subunit Sec63